MGAIPWNMNVLLVTPRLLSFWAAYTQRLCSAWRGAENCPHIASAAIGASV
jgi:hypothetical protein